MIITRGLSQSQRIITRGFGKYATIAKILYEILNFVSKINQELNLVSSFNILCDFNSGITQDSFDTVCNFNSEITQSLLFASAINTTLNMQSEINQQLDFTSLFELEEET